MKNLTALLITVFAMCSLSASAQNIEHQIVASQYGAYQVPTVGQQYSFPPASCQIAAGGKNFPAFATGVPIKIVDSNIAHIEVVTPVAVNLNNNNCSVSMSTTYGHLSFYLTSGTGGLQEALNAGQVTGGANTVILDQQWYAQVAPSTPATVIAAVHGTTALGLVDVTTTPYSYYAWNGTNYAVTSAGGGTTTNSLTFDSSGSGAASGTSFNGTTAQTISTNTIGAAPVNSPAFTGTPSAPIQAVSTNSTAIATTAAVVTALIPYAPLASPAFTGTVTAPTVSILTNNTQIATTSAVSSALLAYAPANNAALTGTPTAPTQACASNTDIATGAYVANCGAIAGVSSFKARTGAVVPVTGDYTVAQVTGAAPTASPTFTGTATAPTAAISTNNTNIATTAAVTTALVGYAPLASPSFTGTVTAPTAAISTNNTNVATTAAVTTALGSYAPLASPALTGTPTVPTAASGTSSTQAASTAFVQGAIPSITPAFSAAQIAGTADSYATLQAVFTAAQTGCQEVYIPAGTYKTSAGLTYSANCVRIRGAGPSSTSITASATGYNTMTVGNGNGVQGTPTGYVQGLHLIGAGRSNAGFSALQINGLDEFRVVDVTTDTADIGFDMINNCFGSQFENIRGGFGGTLNAALYFRTGTASGSDISVYNPWINGQICGECIANQVGGIHTYGGQVDAGQGTSSVADASGAFTLGKDYLTGATGEYNVDVNGTSIEGTTYAWAFRGFSQGHLVTNALGGNPTSNTAPAIGFFKNVNALNSTVELHGTILTGYWSNAALIVNGGGYGNNSFLETGTYSAAQNPTINGSSTFVNCMVTQSSLSNGVCINNNNNVSAPALTLSGATGTQCLEEIGGVITPTGTDCASGPFLNAIFNGTFAVDNQTATAVTGTNAASITHFLEYSYCSLSSPCTPLTGTFSMTAVPGTGVEPSVVMQFASSAFGHPCPTGGCSYNFDNPISMPSITLTSTTASWKSGSGAPSGTCFNGSLYTSSSGTTGGTNKPLHMLTERLAGGEMTIKAGIMVSLLAASAAIAFAQQTGGNGAPGGGSVSGCGVPGAGNIGCGGGRGGGVPAGSSCVDGPTTNLISRFDALTLAPCSGGTVSSWTSGFGTNTATGVNGPTCVANVFGSSPGVLFNSASSQLFTLSNPLSFGSGMTVMTVWKPVTVNSKMDITGSTSGSAGFVYYVTSASSAVQGADSGFVAGLGTGTATSSAGNIYQSNVSYTGSVAPTFRLNKSADATVGGATSAITNTIGELGNDSIGTEYLNAYIGAIYVFSPALSTANIQSWESTLSCKYPGA